MKRGLFVDGTRSGISATKTERDARAWVSATGNQKMALELMMPIAVSAAANSRGRLSARNTNHMPKVQAAQVSVRKTFTAFSAERRKMKRNSAVGNAESAVNSGWTCAR